jgi:hypothetical protein
VLLGREPGCLRLAAPEFERLSPAVYLAFIDVVVELGAVFTLPAPVVWLSSGLRGPGTAVGGERLRRGLFRSK